MKEIIGDYETFISSVSTGLKESGIQRSELAMMDHICYRVGTQDRYNQLRGALSTIATFLGETIVAGRSIATFELHSYAEVDGWIVPYVELPEPKDGSPYVEGLEHAELVVVGSLTRFANRHPELVFDTKGLAKDINPELSLKTDTFSVKFHEQPLGAVVRIEQRLDRE
jgi:uncharacterized protein